MAITPVLQEINAFDVSKGTTIYFTITSSTEFIRSSIVTFTDVLTGEDVAENAYSTTQLFNIIPSNLEGLENGKQYNIRVDVYTQVDPTGHESAGTSVAKSIWCLPTPELEITRPDGTSPTTVIETNSYTFDASFIMYDDPSLTSLILNRIQSYKFDLYNGTIGSSTLVESSDLIYGTGTKISDVEYLLQYTFNGLENYNSYYIVLSITTEQGMDNQAISTYILPALDDITFAVAEVKNNSCNGYIEVKSNITNIAGYTNADFITGSGEIYLTNEGDFVVWGYNPEDGEEEYSISFPTGDWSMLISAKELSTSSASPTTPNDESFILRMGDYRLSNYLVLYCRYEEQTDSTWLELYVINRINSDSMVFIQSNELIGVNYNEPLYILLRYIDGYYDIQISTELGS